LLVQDIALSRSNDLSGERVHDLERSTANHVLQRTADLRTNRDSIINKNRDRLHFSESVLTSDQRVLVLKRAAALQGEIPCRCITG